MIFGIGQQFIGQKAQFIVAIVAAGSGTSAALTGLGVQVGDFGLFASVNSSAPTTAGGAWTAVGNDGAYRYAKRLMTSADIAAGVTYGTDCSILFYRGVGTAAMQALLTYSGSTPVTAGAFTPATTSVGVALFPYSNNGTLPTISAPTGFVSRGNAIVGSAVIGASDRLTGANFPYAGTNFTVAFGGGITSGVCGIIDLIA